MTHTRTTNSLSPRQHNAILALLRESNVRQAAQASGTPERTLHRWLTEPSFQDAYRAARRESVRQAVARLQQASSTAVGVLVEIMQDKAAPPAARLGAAAKVLDLAIKAVELEDLDARLRALEHAYAQKP